MNFLLWLAVVLLYGINFKRTKEAIPMRNVLLLKMNYTTIWYHFGINVYGLIITICVFIIVVEGLATLGYAVPE